LRDHAADLSREVVGDIELVAAHLHPDPGVTPADEVEDPQPTTGAGKNPHPRDARHELRHQRTGDFFAGAPAIIGVDEIDADGGALLSRRGPEPGGPYSGEDIGGLWYLFADHRLDLRHRGFGLFDAGPHWILGKDPDLALVTLRQQ